MRDEGGCGGQMVKHAIVMVAVLKSYRMETSRQHCM